MKGSLDKYRVRESSKPRWRYRISLPKDEAGRRRYIAQAGFSREADAAEAMRVKMEELKRPAAPAVSQETFGAHLRAWLEQHVPQRCAPKTLERYVGLAAYVLKDADGNESTLAKTVLRDVTAAQLETVLYDLLRAPAKLRKHLSAKTVRHVAGVINAAMNKAFRLGKIDFNPLSRVELPTTEKRDARALGPDEIQALLEVCLNDWTHPFVQVALATACRRGELLSLTWADIDFGLGAVIVSKSLEQTRSGLRVKRPKSGRQRTFQLPQAAIVSLRFQQESQKEHRRMFGADYADLNLVFCRPDGSYLNPALVSQTIVRRILKAGIANASLHSLRHTHASGLLSQRVPLPVVSARLGHANTNITASIYAHAMPADDQQAADKWDELITRKPQ